VSDSLDAPDLLDGGELLLSTGAGWPEDAELLRAFAQRLAAVPIAGLVLELGARFAETADVDAAIDAAKAALPAWRATSLIKSADVFFRLRHLLRERTPELAAIVTDEHGKVLSDAAGEISRGIENVEFASGLVHLL
ncbi:aldehyde dehydrogenase family protein, partial [Rhizobium johnstonii]|uniref:aldehyde dehydrogenase family protein n=1 Tax=Rhizobium johnstonii TaxID=3019933 RepID=UPI003F96C1FF